MFDNITLASVVGIDLSFIIEFIGCLIFSFTGSILKEIYNTNSIKGYRFAPHKVISSTIVAALASAAFKVYLLDNPSWELMAFITFTFGLLGFEIFKDLSTIDGIKKLIFEFRYILNLLANGEKKITHVDNQLNDKSEHHNHNEITLHIKPRVHDKDSDKR